MSGEEEKINSILPLKDLLELISGKWRIVIIYALLHDDKRYKELFFSISGISSKVLSKELYHLEENLLIQKKVYDEKFKITKYSLTEHGRSLAPLLEQMSFWGKKHRSFILSH